MSEQVRDDLVRFRIAPPEKISVVQYGFDLDARVGGAAAHRAEKRHGSSARTSDTFVVGWAGRLAEIKRPLDLVRTIAEIPDARLVIAGDGELRPAVESLARRARRRRPGRASSATSRTWARGTARSTRSS